MGPDVALQWRMVRYKYNLCNRRYRNRWQREWKRMWHSSGREIR